MNVACDGLLVLHFQLAALCIDIALRCENFLARSIFFSGIYRHLNVTHSFSSQSMYCKYGKQGDSPAHTPVSWCWPTWTSMLGTQHGSGLLQLKSYKPFPAA